jgi:hypothetical protein
VEGSGTKSPKKKKRGAKSKKKAQRSRQEPKEDSDEAFTVNIDRKGPRGPPRSGGPFDNMLKKSCPYHMGPVKHTLEECDMLRNYFNRLGCKDEGGRKDADNQGSDGFPPVENIFICGGPTTNITPRQCKRKRREVFSIHKAAPSFLD